MSGSTFMKQILDLYRNEEVKAQFLANYSKAGESRQTAEMELVSIFQSIYSNNVDETQPNPPLFMCDVESIKRVLLVISEQGLFLSPKKKEVALITANGVNGKPYMDFLLRYRGMYKLVANSNKVLASSVEIVYRGDQFEWRGSKVEPTYVMNLNHDRETMVAGFCSFTMKNGTTIAHLMNGEELDEMVRLGVQAAELNGGDTELLTGPWRERSLKAKVFRSAYNLHKSLLIDNKAMINAQTDDTEVAALDTLARNLEATLSAAGGE